MEKRDDAVRISQVTPKEGFILHLQFDDGTAGQVDLSDLAGQGVFTGWCENDAFFHLKIGSAGELSWDCGVDMWADALYLRLTGKNSTEVFRWGC